MEIRYIDPLEPPFSEEEYLTKKDDIEGHPVHYIQCQCSIAHTFGNVTAFIQNWLLSEIFPPKTFRTIHVNSKIAHQQLRSTPHEFLKKTPPMFIIRPRVDWNDPNVFLKGTPLIERQGDLYHTYGGTNLQPFFQDNKNKIAVKYQMNRHVINFDVLLVFNTLMQQINWMNYIKNAVRYEHPFFLETYLESYIAPEMMLQLAEFAGIPMIDESGSNVNFMRYLMQNSIYPVTYKLQGSTNTDEYYRYYPTHLDVLISNLDAADGERIGYITDRYTISFTIRVEFESTGFYYLFSDKVSENSFLYVENETSAIIPLFTDVLTLDDVDLPVGWQIVSSPSCRLEFSNDHVSLSSVINESIKLALQYHFERGIPIDQFFKIRVRKQGKLTQEGVDWIFDYNKYELYFFKQNTYFTYKIFIMVNVEYINNLIKDVYKLK